MSAAAKAPATAAAKPRVAIIGGGVAGLACALKLVKRGCHVTLYEAADRLGGNISSSGPFGGPYQDVYPHIFPDWYANFWSLLEDELGLRREDLFAPRWGVKVLDKPPAGPSATEPPAFMDLVNTPTLRSLVTTMRSGLLSIPDLFLFGFLTLDLAAQPPDPSDTDMLCQLDVNAFYYSREYSTDAIAALQDYIITVIWSIPSYMTSAKVYKKFIKHQLSSLGPEVPYAWLLRGSLQEKIIAPIEQTLRHGGCEIRTGVKVRSVEVMADGAPRLQLEETASDGVLHEPPNAPPVDYVVMAVPGPILAEMVMTGQDGLRLVDKVSDLAQLRRVWGEAIPVVNLYFKRKLPFMPPEIVGLRGSGYDLTVVDISQLWDRKPDEPDVTVLILAASNAYAIPAQETPQAGYLMIRRLRDYLWFNLGEAWGDDDDVDWKRTTVRSNKQHQLFVNDVGSRLWRPRTSYGDQLSRVFFAGDVCQTDVDMATVEAAVQSGVMAAQAIQQAELGGLGGSAMSADPIALAPHRVLSDATFLAAKLALLPFAYAASALSAVTGGQPAVEPSDGVPPAYSAAKRALLLPLDYVVDWWRTVYWLQRALAKGAKDGPVDGVDPVDAPVGLGVRGLWSSGSQPLTFRSAPAQAHRSKAPAPDPVRARAARSLLSAAAVLAGQVAQLLQDASSARKKGAPDA